MVAFAFSSRIFSLPTRIVTILFLLIFSAPPLLFAVESAPKITDREIIESLAELKAGQKALQQQMDDLKTSTRQQTDDLKTSLADLRNLIYVVLSGMFGLFGFVLWDRRTALVPAIRKQNDLEEREALIEKALAEYAVGEPRLADILHKLRLM